jgi:hypothetical protein
MLIEACHVRPEPELRERSGQCLYKPSEVRTVHSFLGPSSVVSSLGCSAEFCSFERYSLDGLLEHRTLVRLLI